jgi:hypothetical protein
MLGLYALLAMLGAAFGLILADIDQNIPFIKHRSIFTHGVLWPLVAYYLAEIANPYVLAATFGFLSGYAVHLVFDMWPQSWHGIALIHVVGHIRLWAILSFIWLGLGVVAAMYVMSLLAAKWLVGLALFVCFAYKSKYEQRLIFPLLTICLISAGGLYFLEAR